MIKHKNKKFTEETEESISNDKDIYMLFEQADKTFKSMDCIFFDFDNMISNFDETINSMFKNKNKK